MSDPDILRDIATYIFKWNALSDACPKCRSLDQKEYDDQRIYQNTLWDGQWGDIWDLNADRSLAHPNCRCQVAVRVEFDWSKWEVLQELRETIYRYRKPVTIYRSPETGRFISPRRI